MSDEEMHEDKTEAEDEAEVKAKDAVEAEGEDDAVEFQNPFEGQPDPDVFPGGPSDKSVLTEYGATLQDVYMRML
jgi:hypothetical protein